MMDDKTMVKDFDKDVSETTILHHVPTQREIKGYGDQGK